jgi:hypothetical protein
MTDQDREAFPSVAAISAMADTWAERTGIAEKLKTLPSNLPTAEMRGRHDELVLRHVKLSYEEGVVAGLQAASAHYAPKVTERAAVEILRQVGFGPKTKIKMLRAAGVKFRDEA